MDSQSMTTTTPPRLFGDISKLDAAGVSVRRALVLWLISQGIDTNRDLAAHFGTSTSHVSQSLQWLRDEGYLARAGSRGGPEAKRLRPTSKGTKFLQRVANP